jgi:hypothetical protein
MSRLIGNNRPGGMLLLLVPALLLAAAPAFGGQDYVTQFDAFGGYAFLNSPAIGLFENGFATQLGFRPKTWLSAGFDYSITAGDGTVTPNLLQSALQQELGAELGQLEAMGQIPPGFALTVPIHSRTQTFAAGPQISFRHFTHETIFWRPVFAGAIYERATPQPTNQIAAAIAAQLVPSGVKTDTTWFVGVGGGIDVLLTRHFAIRTQVDVVWDHLFPDLLANGRWTVRFSTGPAFNFGKNIKKSEN